MGTQMSETLYKATSERRKKQQAEGTLPQWYTTAGLAFFEQKYSYNGCTVKDRWVQIAKQAASHLVGTKYEAEAEKKFFDLMWNGWLSLSTPVFANMGTDRGLAVSCAGTTIGDSVYDFYGKQLETAMLTKLGFGTAGYLGNIRSRGSKISIGGKASGVVPVFKDFVQLSRDVSQGSTRRGAWAGYLPIDHGDFDELCDYVFANPDDANVGWCVYDSFIEKLKAQDQDAIRRFQKVMKLKMVTGKGYFHFTDKVNRLSPPMYKDRGLDVVTSQLCSEVSGFSGVYNGEDYSFTCVLSSMNAARYDEWKDTDAVFWSTVFLDCVAQDLIVKGEHIKGIEAAIRFTKASRMLGLGVCGFHTYLMEHSIPFESLDARFFNNDLFKHINEESIRASKDMAIELGEPEFCKGYGLRNTHRLAIAPTKSSASLMGNVSEGINPDPAMTFVQQGAAGEIERICGPLVKLMKHKGVYTKANVQQVIDADGSVQDVQWLTDEEKLVFKTAFEINQETIIRLASQRQRYIDQSQSLNLFIDSDEDPLWVSHLHKMAFEDPYIKNLYYVYSTSGVKASKECVACS